ncbi:FAD-dependent monooxygenase [Streptomyces sp. NPDC004267]|uniref:FAD-dependent monooxygenase n=1 Tax=Streptomyces sp. NPDC004267 TaxID=3364694 RepID=UPI0036878F47
MPDRTAAKVDICVVGSGPPGLALAKAMADAGRNVAVVGGDDIGETGALAMTVLQPGALQALDALGLRRGVEARAQRLDGYDTYVNGERIAALRYADLSESPAPYGLGATGEMLRRVFLEDLADNPRFAWFEGSRVRSLLRRADGGLDGIALTSKDGEPFVVGCRVVVITEGDCAAAGALAGIATHPVERGDEALTFSVPRPAGWPDVLSNHYRDDNRYLSIAPSGPDRLSVLWGIRSGTFDEVRDRGFEALRKRILSVEPRLEQVFDEIRGCEDAEHHALTGYLADRWVADGLLLAGNAAYSLPAFGGQDHNLPLHDAVSAARVIEKALRGNDVSATSLGEFERERRPLVENIAAFWGRGSGAGTALPSGPVSGAVVAALNRMFRSMALGPEAWRSSAAPAAAAPLAAEPGRDPSLDRPAFPRTASLDQAATLDLAWLGSPQDDAPGIGRLLWQLAKVSGTHRVFDFGSASGSSTVWLARAAGPEGRVYRSEPDAVSAAKARELVDRAGVGGQVEILVADAAANLRAVEGAFDLMLCDVAREPRPGLLAEALRRLRPGGLFIADNALLGRGRARHGGILDEMFAERSLFTTLIPLDAGLAVGVKQ